MFLTRYVRIMATVQVPTISYYSGVVLYGFGGSDLNDFDVRLRIHLYNLVIDAFAQDKVGRSLQWKDTQVTFCLQFCLNDA